MKISIKKIFAIVLMSTLANVALAQDKQAPKTTECAIPEMVTVLSSLEVQAIKENLKTNNRNLTFQQKGHLVDILRTRTSTDGYIWKDSVIVASSKKGDEWQAYLSKKSGKFYLTYVVSRNEFIVGMDSIPLN